MSEKYSYAAIDDLPVRRIVQKMVRQINQLEDRLSGVLKQAKGQLSPPEIVSVSITGAVASIAGPDLSKRTGDIGLLATAPITVGRSGNNFTVGVTTSGINHPDLGGLLIGDAGHTQFLRSNTSDSFTSGTLTFDAGTTLDINGTIDIAGATWAGQTIDHGANVTGLGDDDHTIYALLLGRSGGQILIGGIGSGDDLTLRSTSHATPGTIICADAVSIANNGAAKVLFRADAAPFVTDSGLAKATTGTHHDFRDSNGASIATIGSSGVGGANTDIDGGTILSLGASTAVSVTLGKTAGAVTCIPNFTVQGATINFGADDTSDPTMNWLGSTNDGDIIWDESEGGFISAFPWSVGGNVAAPGSSGREFQVRKDSSTASEKMAMYFQMTHTSDDAVNVRGIQGFCQSGSSVGQNGTYIAIEGNAAFSDGGGRWGNELTALSGVVNISNLGASASAGRPVRGVYSKLRITGGAAASSNTIGLMNFFEAEWDPSGGWDADIVVTEMNGLYIDPTDTQGLGSITNWHGIRILHNIDTNRFTGGDYDSILIDSVGRASAAEGNIRFAGGRFDEGHLQINDSHLWYDDSITFPIIGNVAVLRFNPIEPTSDSDGVAVGSGLRTFPLTLANAEKGGTAPADGTIGTTPTVHTLLFTTTSQFITLTASMPTGWDTTKDVIVVLRYALDVAESDADELSLTIDYVCTREGVTGQGANKTSTQLTPTSAVSTAEGLAQFDQYEITWTFDKDDANNGFDGVTGDPVDFRFEVKMTNTTGVGTFHLLDGYVVFASLY